MKRTIAVIIAGTFAAAGASVGLWAQAHNHVIQAPTETKWGPAPPMLPPGAEIAVLSGDPSKPSAYTVRLKFPANYAIQAHSHPTDENVVVTTGALTFGMTAMTPRVASDSGELRTNKRSQMRSACVCCVIRRNSAGGTSPERITSATR